MALPPFPPKKDDEDKLPPVGIGAIFQAKPQPAPQIGPTEVDQILKHFQAEQREQVDRLFDPFLLAENVIGGAVRGAFKPEEVGASNPHEGAMKGVAEALPKDFGELLTYAPGGAKPPAEESYGEPFKVGKDLAPNSPVGAFLIGAGISMSVPGPDFIKALKEGKSAEVVIGRAAKKLQAYEGGLLELATPKGNLVIKPTDMSTQTVVQLPNQGLSFALKRRQLRLLAPRDPVFANAAVGDAFVKVAKHRADPADMLMRGDPVPIALLPESRFAEKLRSPLKAMASNPKSADNILQLLVADNSKAKWIIYDPDDPTQFVTYVLPKPYDVPEFPTLEELGESLAGFMTLGDAPDALWLHTGLLQELLPTGVVKGDLKVYETADRILPTTTAPVEVMARRTPGHTIKGRTVPLSSSSSGSAVAFQALRRATGEISGDVPIKVIHVPTAHTGLTIQTIFDPLPTRTADTVVTQYGMSDLLDVIEELKPELRNKARDSLAKIAATDVVAGREKLLAYGDTKFYVNMATGEISRELDPLAFSTHGLEPIDTDPLEGSFESALSYVDGTPEWESIQEILGLNDTHVENVILEVGDNLKSDPIYAYLDSLAKVVDLDNASISRKVIEENTAQSELLIKDFSDVSIPIGPAKTLPKVNTYVRIKRSYLPADVVDKTGGRLALRDWTLVDGVNNPVLQPDQTFKDLIGQIAGDKAAEAFEQEVRTLVQQGDLTPAYLMSPRELAPQLINAAGRFNPVVDAQGAAQGFKVYVEEMFPKLARNPRELERFYLVPKGGFSKQLFEIAGYYHNLSKENPEEFAKLVSLTATLQSGQTQVQLSRYFRNTGAIEALERAGVEVHATGRSRTIASSVTTQTIPIVEGEGMEFLKWTPETVADLLIDPAKVDEMFQKHAHELPELELRRVADMDRFVKMVRAQLPGLPSEITSEWIGVTVKDFGYPATSFNPAWDPDKWDYGNLVLEILVPKGTKGVSPGLLSAGYATETEIVLDRNLPMRVIDVGKTKMGYPKLVLEVLKNVGAGVVVAEVGASFLERTPQMEALQGKPGLEEP